MGLIFSSNIGPSPFSLLLCNNKLKEGPIFLSKSRIYTRLFTPPRDLFFTQGFRAISLDEISERVGIKTASLYYHFPDGKEQIFIAVITERFESYREKIATFTDEKSSLREFLVSFGQWYCEQKQMNMLFLSEMDMPHLTLKGQQTLMESGANNVFSPLKNALERFPEKLNPNYETMDIVGHYLSLLGSLPPSAKYSSLPLSVKVEQISDLILKGILI